MPSWDKDEKNYCRQPWKRGSDRYSIEEKFSQSCKAKFLSEPQRKIEERKQMSLAPWEWGIYVDKHDLENDDKINPKKVYRFRKDQSNSYKQIILLKREPIATWKIAGYEGIRMLSGERLYGGEPDSGDYHGYDTSGIAIRFSEAGGEGIDRGGLAFSYYQKYDKKKYKNRKTGKTICHGPGEGTETNAARHTLWNMLNVHVTDINKAKEIVDSHETNPRALENDKIVFDTNDYSIQSCDPPEKQERRTAKQCAQAAARADADEVIDLLNNQIGRNLGLQIPSGSPIKTFALAMLDYFYFYGLYTMEKTGDKYEVVKTRITKEQYDHMKYVYNNELDQNGINIIKYKKYVDDIERKYADPNDPYNH